MTKINPPAGRPEPCFQRQNSRETEKPRRCCRKGNGPISRFSGRLPAFSPIQAQNPLPQRGAGPPSAKVPAAVRIPPPAPDYPARKATIAAKKSAKYDVFVAPKLSASPVGRCRQGTSRGTVLEAREQCRARQQAVRTPTLTVAAVPQAQKSRGRCCRRASLQTPRSQLFLWLQAPRSSLASALDAISGVKHSITHGQDHQ